MNFAPITLVTLFGIGLAVEPTVRCPVPVSPPNGQVFLMKDGTFVKYTCNKGFKLLGSDVANCKEDIWTPEPPICIEENEALPNGMTAEDQQVTQASTTQRPLFKWDDSDNPTTTSPPEESDSDDLTEKMQSDEARLHMLLYPDRRQLFSQNEDFNKGTTTKSGRAPSMIYVRRGRPGLGLLRNRAAVRDSNDDDATTKEKESEVEDLPQSDERWRYLHWLAQAGYNYPNTAASWMYGLNGHPVVMTLSESQLAWINSLHPELRDRYLKDIYKTRTNEYTEGLRAQYLYGHYGGDPYNAYHYWYYYNDPYYTRQPVSAPTILEDPIASFDYSCHQVDESGRASLIRAPTLRNGYVYRYDRRRNPKYPNNHYLSVEYRCNAGYVLLDSRVNELHCSKKGWVGRYPVCVPRG